ncbi:MAG: asparaginase [Candidatus Bipolaricaulota bacterium]|nr:MAG: asparaginase [Candidatus Bipolaricaulota bacterium]
MDIHFITAGGTIDKVYFDGLSDYRVGDSLVAQLLVEAGVTLPFEVTPILRKDSLEMTPEDRRSIRDAAITSPCARIIVTHGTDTIRETAHELLGIEGKTIVLTGAMQPARFRQTDAVFNVASAVIAVQLLPPGVYVAMNGRVFDPRACRKNREAQCFEVAEAVATDVAALSP